jgi:hypothetical protein
MLTASHNVALPLHLSRPHPHQRALNMLTASLNAALPPQRQLAPNTWTANLSVVQLAQSQPALPQLALVLPHRTLLPLLLRLLAVPTSSLLPLVSWLLASLLP